MKVRRACRGFTLIEITVVVLIIVIVLGIVGVNLEPDRNSAVREEAQRLAFLLHTAQQEAVLQGKVLAVALQAQGYSFVMLNDKNEFKPMPDDEIFRARSLPPNISISAIDIEGAAENEAPRLVILPTGELPAFIVTFSRDSAHWQVVGTETGEITARVAPAVKT
ncbi:MAG: GspH/FimT family pseudopilin [Gammaproteobacteria bacterium]|nr:GspH/FimT family pseudopilin [Gammaproteobacteria bacterium]